MNVSCPECASVFRVDPRKVPRAGVRARCSVCGGVITIGVSGAIDNEFVTARGGPPLAVARGAAGTQTVVPPAVAAPVASSIAPAPPTPRAAPPSDSRPALTIDPRPAAPASAPLPPRPPITMPTPPMPGRPVAPVTVAGDAHGLPPIAPPPAAPAPAMRIPESAAAAAPPPIAAAPPASPRAEPSPVRMDGGIADSLPTALPAPGISDSLGAPSSMASAAAALAALGASFAPAPSMAPPPVSPSAPQGGAGSLTAVTSASPAMATAAVAAPAAPSAPSAPAAAPAPARPAARPGVAPGSRPPINPFLANDPNTKAKRLARALISDIIAYFPDKHRDGLRNGTLPELFREEIKKSYEEYVDQMGEDFARTTTHFQDALNDVLAGGKKVFRSE